AASEIANFIGIRCLNREAVQVDESVLVQAGSACPSPEHQPWQELWHKITFRAQWVVPGRYQDGGS
ncbi:MAG: hypothetical protein ABIY38_04915, partial [Rhodococcus sp. (in: high G+C Gram-positive bacteria)]